jgi:hypothetical protein
VAIPRQRHKDIGDNEQCNGRENFHR